MIVKVLKPRAAGSGRGLATYILGLKHEREHDRLGPYVPDDDPKIVEKIAWTRAVGTSTDSAADAISEIEEYNAQNLRKHKISRWEHVVISFPEDERPT